MSYKLYSRLVGKITTGIEALKHTSPASTTTPFDDQAPGTKFMAYGENATSLAFNRAIGAVATNVDSIAGLLNSPALRSEMLRPSSNDGEPGFESLFIESPTQKKISLAGEDGFQPSVWVYCGLTSTALTKNTRIFHIDGSVGAGESHRSNYVNSDNRSFSNFNIAPVDCYENSALEATSTSYYLAEDGTGQGYLGSHDSGIPTTIPNIRRIISDLSPYSGETKLLNVNDWDSDGLYLSAIFADTLCLRSGCFVEVINSGDPDGEIGNNGLFRIESIAYNQEMAGSSQGSKLVLSRGNLHKVTVDESKFTVGELVSWQTVPNHADDSSAEPTARDNYAHIMYIISRPDISGTAVDLYLSDFSGPNNHRGAEDRSGKLSAGHASEVLHNIQNYGSVGLADQEEGAEQNSSLPIGTRLYNLAATTNAAGPEAGYATVTAVLPSHYPIVFSVKNTPGQMYPCTPPGFLLNPVLEFDDDLLPGNNYLWAKTLTTVRDQIRSKNDGYNALSAEDASSEPYQSRQDVMATEVLLRHIHQGHVVDPNVSSLNGPKSLTASILGPSLWKLRIQSIDEVFSFDEAFRNAGKVYGRDFVTFIGSKAANDVDNVLARPLSSVIDPDTGDSIVVVSDVFRVRSYEDSIHGKHSLRPGCYTNIEVEGTKHEFSLVSIKEGPWLSDKSVDELDLELFEKGSDLNYKFAMDYGLNAVFHAQNSSIEALRSNSMGLGNVIFVPGGSYHYRGRPHPSHTHRPFTTVLEGLEADEIGHAVVSDQDEVTLIELHARPGRSRARISFEQVGTFEEGTLRFRDEHTKESPLLGSDKSPNVPLIGVAVHNGDLAFSGSSRNTPVKDDDGYIDDGFAHNHADLPSEVWDQNMLASFEAGILGNMHRTTKYQELTNFGVFSNGFLWGADAHCWNDFEQANPNAELPDVNYDDGGNSWVGTETHINLTEGYIFFNGAKNYIGPASIDLSDEDDYGPNGHGIVYYDVDDSAYKVSATAVEGGIFQTFVSDRKIVACYFRLEAGSIVELIDIRSRICHTDKRDQIVVGYNSSSNEHFLDLDEPAVFESSFASQGGMSFPTLGAAFAAMRIWDTHIDKGRKWKVIVAGHTYEKDNPRRGYTYPIQVPCDSFVIEGFGGKTNDLDAAGTPWLDTGVKSPIIKAKISSPLFDLGGRSDVVFRNLSIEFDGPESESSLKDSLSSVGLFAFVNNKSTEYLNDEAAVEWRDEDDMYYGTGASAGRYGPNAPYYPGAPALQKNILIDGVQVSGLHHGFFFHGRDNTIEAPNTPRYTEIPFDNLTIQNCNTRDGLYGFVQIAPTNALNSMYYHDSKGNTVASSYPYYWRNINILNCSAIGKAGFTLELTGIQEFEDSLFLDAIHLAACKEVTVRDCKFSHYLRGIVFGPGNWSHYSTGLIENNTLNYLYSDAIVAMSESNVSGITIRNNKIVDWGKHWEETVGTAYQYDIPEVEAEQDRWYRAVAERYNRFAAVRIAGNSINVVGNTFDSASDAVANSSQHLITLNGEDILGTSEYWKVTQGVFISKDLYGFDGAVINNHHWGIRIVDNTHVKYGTGGAFIYSDIDYLVDATISGNTFRATGSDRPYGLERTHPMWYGAAIGSNAWFYYSEDAHAIGVDGIQDSHISDNCLQGHISIQSCNGLKITDNQLTFPSTVVHVNGGMGFSFSGNQLHNGTLIFNGETADITNNNFSTQGEGNGSTCANIYKIQEEYLDESKGIGELRPGILMSLEDSLESFESLATISNNLMGPTPLQVTETFSPAIIEETDYHNLNSEVRITGSIGTIVHFSDNVMLNPYVQVDAPVALTMTDNSLIHYDGTLYGTLPIVLDISNTADDYSIEAQHLAGFDHRLNISGNNFVGSVRINGASGETPRDALGGESYRSSFDTWTGLFSAYQSGMVFTDESTPMPDGGSLPIMARWGDGDPDGQRPWHHNKLKNVNILNNNFKGNVTLIGLKDSNFANNRLQGAIDREFTNIEGRYNNGIGTDFIGERELTDAATRSIDLYTSGQVELLGCTRLNITGSKLASLYVAFSKEIRASECSFGHTEIWNDRFGRSHRFSSATYSPTNQGRIFALYCPHLNIESCRITDPTADKFPRKLDLDAHDPSSRSENPYGSGYSYTGRSYQNDPLGAVYSSLLAAADLRSEHNINPMFIRDIVGAGSAGVSSSGLYVPPQAAFSDVYVVDVVAMACPAISIKDSHLGRAHLVASDDCMVHGNRFYYGGDQPKWRRNLVINESSMRPSIQSNHFTASVEIGDPNTWEYHTMQATDRNSGLDDEAYFKVPKWIVKLEKTIRHPVHAQISGNRFDCAVGKHFDTWHRDYFLDQQEELMGQMYGSGDLIIHNYGGSLISNNHLMKSPYGYMMHSANEIVPQGSEEEIEWVNALGLLGLPHAADTFNHFKWERKDLDNRIGGSIKLDPFSSYNEVHYTWAHILSGAINLDWEQYDTATRVAGGDSLSGMFDNWQDVSYHYAHIGTGMNRSPDELAASTGIDWSNDAVQTHFGEPTTGPSGADMKDSPSNWSMVFSNLGEVPTTDDVLQFNNPDGSGYKYMYTRGHQIQIPWGGTYAMNFFASSHSIMAHNYIQLPQIGGSKRIYAHEHYPKTMGCFAIGNVCKKIIMSKYVRQSSWAYGRHCDIRIQREIYESPTNNDTMTLPAQAYETPLNPMHANNHSQFNMLRHKDHWIDLSITGNFGSYLIRTNPDLDAQFGGGGLDTLRRQRLYKAYDDFGQERYTQVGLFAPERPNDHYLFGATPNGHCDPWNKPHLFAGVDPDKEDSDTPTDTTTSCVLSGTMIETSRGIIPVEDVLEGDSVRSYDFEMGDFGYYDVINVMEPVERESWVIVTTETGRQLRCTPEHPLYSLTHEGNELPVNEASIGDVVYVIEDGEMISDAIASIDKIDEPATVHNFEVSEVQSYISDGVLSHNKIVVDGGGGTVAYPPPGGTGGGGGIIPPWDDGEDWDDDFDSDNPPEYEDEEGGPGGDGEDDPSFPDNSTVP